MMATPIDEDEFDITGIYPSAIDLVKKCLDEGIVKSVFYIHQEEIGYPKRKGEVVRVTVEFVPEAECHPKE